MAESISTEHCFHTEKPLTLLTASGPLPVICCYCNLKAVRNSVRIAPPGHGPFAPKSLAEFRYKGLGANDECLDVLRRSNLQDETNPPDPAF